MKTLAFTGRALAPLAAILIVAATATIADARIGGLNMGAPRNMTTPHIGLGAQMDRRPPPPQAPPAVGGCPGYGWRCPTFPQGGGGTGGFSPGGGSGPTVKKKPNLQ